MGNVLHGESESVHVSKSVIPVIDYYLVVCESSFSAVKSFKLHERMLFMKCVVIFNTATSKNVVVNKVVMADLRFRVGYEAWELQLKLNETGILRGGHAGKQSTR